jgi:uncharacterized membrane-anchored protein
LLRIVLAILLWGAASASAWADAKSAEAGSSAGKSSARELSAEASGADALETPDQVLESATRQSIGAPARADIGGQATVRLSEGLMIVPRIPATRLLRISNFGVPADFEALLIGSEGMDAPGIIRFVPAGFIDSNAALAWTADDMLSSLKDTVERGNPDRVKHDLLEREARRWVRAPHYDPETHQISWAALILPKGAPRDSDGEITFHAIGFGRAGYVELTVVTGLEKAAVIGQMVDDFLFGLSFQPGKAYGDVLPTDPRAAAGLAGAMGLDALHKAQSGGGLLAGDTLVPVAGGLVAAIGALSLFIYIRRHLRREARRI